MAGATWGAEPVVLKIATISPEGTALTNAFKAASKEMESRTGGRVKLKVYAGGVMGNDSVVLRKMRIDQIHGSTFTAGGISAVYSNFQLMSLPLLFTDYKEVDSVRSKIDGKLIKELEKAGFISFGIIEGGFVYMMSSHPISGPDNLRGRKVWVPEDDPIGRAVFQESGVAPVPLPLPDVLTGLQTGLVDTVASSPAGAVILQWFTRFRHITEHPLIYLYGTFALTSRAWDRIPAADRPVVREILTRIVKKADTDTRKDNQQALQTLKKQGLTLVKVDDGNLKKMRQISDRAIGRMKQHNLFDEAMIKEIRAIVQSVR